MPQVERATTHMNDALQERRLKLVKLLATNCPSDVRNLNSGGASSPSGTAHHFEQSLSDVRFQSIRIAKKLEGARPYSRGGIPTEAVTMAELLIHNAESHSTAKALLGDPHFQRYLKNMTKLLQRKGITEKEIRDNKTLESSILDHITTEWELLKESEMPTSLIHKVGHHHSVFDVAEMYREAKMLFGEDPETEPLVRSAACLVLQGKYDSLRHAFDTYSEALKNAHTYFGNDEHTQDLVRTAASLILRKRHTSVQDAKESYDNALKEAARIFGSEPETQPLVRTAAALVLSKRYDAIGDAKSAYDSIYKEALESFGAITYKTPIRTAALRVFRGRYRSVQQAKKMFDQLLDEAKSELQQSMDQPPLAEVIRLATTAFTTGSSIQELARQAPEHHQLILDKILRGTSLKGYALESNPSLCDHEALKTVAGRVFASIRSPGLTKERAIQVATRRGQELFSLGETDARQITLSIYFALKLESLLFHKSNDALTNRNAP